MMLAPIHVLAQTAQMPAASTQTATPASTPAPVRTTPKGEETKPPEWLSTATVYSPPGCEFQISFPEAPYQTQKCDPIERQNCSPMTTFTKVYDLDATVTFNVSCNPASADAYTKPASADAYTKYDDNVMKTTLLGMSKPANLESFQTGFGVLKEAKMAVLLGSGKAENGKDDMIYTAQLWIGHKSIFTVEGQLRGKYRAEADQLFADTLKTAKLKGPATPVTKDKDADKPDPKPANDAKKTVK